MKVSEWESKVRGLTKEELVHLVCNVMGNVAVMKALCETKEFQVKHDMKCWDCKAIEQKLNG